jgi:hypothetical protein
LYDRGASVTQTSIYQELKNAFRQGGWGDLQRPLADKTDVVPAFIPAASFNLGVGAAAGGVSASEAVFFGGAYNIVKNGIWKLIDNPLQFGNNPGNPPHIRDGADQFDQGILGVKYSQNLGGSDEKQLALNAGSSGRDVGSRATDIWSRAGKGSLGALSPVRELDKYQPGSPTPAFQSDAVYSRPGDSYENFPRISAAAPTASPMAFEASGPTAGPRATNEFGTGGNAAAGFLGRFIKDSPVFAAEAGSRLRGVNAPNLPGEEAASGPSGKASGSPRPDNYPRLRSRVVGPTYPGITPGDPDPSEPPEPAPLLGLVSGRPMVFLPPEVWGQPTSDRPSNSSLLDFLMSLRPNA